MLEKARDYYKELPYNRRLAVTVTFIVLLLFTLPPAAFAASRGHSSFVGPKKYYLALGDSLAFGYQPDLDWNHGYADDFFANLQGHGAKSMANLGCPGETSNTFINGGCPGWLIRKYFYTSSQLNAALAYLRAHAGNVSPVTLDLGGNDLLPELNASACTISPHFNTDLATLDKNLTKTILPQLKKALTVNRVVTGDLLVMNYYDPYQNTCKNSLSYMQIFNSHLANDVKSFGSIVDVFTGFGGSHRPNPNICSYTWMCAINDIHPQGKGYNVIANAFENDAGY